MRELTDHIVSGSAAELRIEVTDEPGAGGANHRYLVKGPDKDFGGGVGVAAQWGQNIDFQRGPIGENGVNGLTNEALLAIVIDRLRGFQSGDFSCRENAIALTKIQEALHWLQHRTRERIGRGVEGASVR